MMAEEKALSPALEGSELDGKMHSGTDPQKVQDHPTEPIADTPHGSHCTRQAEQRKAKGGQVLAAPHVVSSKASRGTQSSGFRMLSIFCQTAHTLNKTQCSLKGVYSS